MNAPGDGMVILDTHAILWWTTLPRRLSRTATTAIAEAEALGVPAIVFWEVAVLVRRGRFALEDAPERWADRVCAIPRVRELPLTRGVAMRADALAMHPDPADRFIVATAIEHGAPIVTKDRPMRQLDIVATVW